MTLLTDPKKAYSFGSVDVSENVNVTRPYMSEFPDLCADPTTLYNDCCLSSCT